MAGKVLVLGCNWGGLGVIHELAAIGADVVAIRTDAGDFAHLSRFARERAALPIPARAELGSIDLLLRRTDWHGACLIATTDPAIELVSRHHDALADHYSFASIPWDRLRVLLDKGRLYRHARDLGLSPWLPRFAQPEGEDDLGFGDDAITYPCLLKPAETHKFVDRFGARLFVVQHRDELAARVAAARDAGLEVLVSEIVPGGDDRLFQYRVYLDRRGETLAEVSTQKLRQHPPSFGCGRLTRTVPLIEELREPVHRLLSSVGYQGYAYAEFKLDPRDGRYKLIEMNVRAGMSQRLLLAAGVNVSQLTVVDCAGGDSPAVRSYRPGVYWIDLFTDPVGFVRWRGVERRPFREYFAPYVGDTVVNAPPWLDPLPFLDRSSSLLRQAARALLRRLRRMRDSTGALATRAALSAAGSIGLGAFVDQ